MALTIKNDTFKGLPTDAYYRLGYTTARNNGELRQFLSVEKFSTAEYRNDNPEDFVREDVAVTYTKEELSQLETIHYNALKRTENFINAEDC